MSKTKQKHDPRALSVPKEPTDTPEQVKARQALRPSINAASVVDAYQGNIIGKDVDFMEMVATIGATSKNVNEGDLTRLEAMLVSQATALQTIFTSLARRAANQEQLKHYETFLTLALKAQAQSRATISALVDLKYPRQATFIKQANVAHGPQQVNNGPAPGGTVTHAEETKTAHPELLEADQHGGTNLDTGTTSKASGTDPHMETLEPIHRAKDARRKS